jgi:DNA-directed RNA polymerase subunit RPC12/RpoP
MTKEEAINYLKSSGMSDEQIRTVVDAFTCEDCISRQAVLDIVRFENKWLFDARSNNVDTDIAFNGIISKVSDLPSVTPQQKTGRWIEKDGYDGDVYYDCSVCGESWASIEGTPKTNGMKYCPNCGAKMEVNKE